MMSLSQRALPCEQIRNIEQSRHTMMTQRDPVIVSSMPVLPCALRLQAVTRLPTMSDLSEACAGHLRHAAQCSPFESMERHVLACPTNHSYAKVGLWISCGVRLVCVRILLDTKTDS